MARNMSPVQGFGCEIRVLEFPCASPSSQLHCSFEISADRETTRGDTD